MYDSDKYETTPAVVASKKMLIAAGVVLQRYEHTNRRIELELLKMINNRMLSP